MYSGWVSWSTRIEHALYFVQNCSINFNRSCTGDRYLWHLMAFCGLTGDRPWNRHHCDLVVPWCTQGHIGSSSTRPAAGWIAACPWGWEWLIVSWHQQRLRRQDLTLFYDSGGSSAMVLYYVHLCPHSNGSGYSLLLSADSDKINLTVKVW